MKEESQLIGLLKEKVENKLGRSLNGLEDYELLHDNINDATGDQVSSTMLMRLWDDSAEGGKPRLSTLNAVAHYVGFASWDDFVAHGEEGEQPAPLCRRRRHRRRLMNAAIGILSAVVIALCCYAIYRLNRQVDDLSQENAQLQQRLQKLKGGQLLVAGRNVYAKPQDYLRFFPLEDVPGSLSVQDVNVIHRIFKLKQEQDNWWYKKLKGMDQIIVWSPTYHHPIWHNDGDSTRLMPTIDEYIDRSQASNETEKSVLNQASNPKLNLPVRQLRITFMQGLSPQGFTFLGVYAQDAEKTTDEHAIWVRVASEVDLSNLKELQALRKKVYNLK